MPALRGEGPADFGRRFPSPRWQLGVSAYNTPTGVVITRVTPYGPAARVGLEPGDRIVAVEGYQVGYVNDALYPLGEELQLRAGPQGQVRCSCKTAATAGC